MGQSGGGQEDTETAIPLKRPLGAALAAAGPKELAEGWAGELGCRGLRLPQTGGGVVGSQNPENVSERLFQ